MRRAAAAGFLCAALAGGLPVGAGADVVDRAALRELARSDGAGVRAASTAALQVPLGDAARAPGSRAELGAIASARGPVRVLVGARAHSAVPGLAAELRRLGARPEAFRLSGVVGATVPSGPALVRALGRDPRVAYIERDRRLRAAVDPFDSVDLMPGGSGIKFTWAYDAVGAAPALAAAGGGSRRTVGVVDTGVDVAHPELAGQVARAYDIFSGGGTVTDHVGHGTFVAGLIAAVDGNGVGGKGVAGTTKLVVVRASRSESFSVRAMVRGIEAAARRGADVVNLSLAGPDLTVSQLRVLQAAFYNDVLPVAASGNNGENGNPLEFPAAAVGGRRGRRGIGLSVTATRPDGSPAGFSTHNDYVSLSAPGAGSAGCELGVFSILPAAGASAWDAQDSCPRLFSQGSARFAYGEGTSFAAPLVSGLAALVWQVQPKLASEQVADVLTRSARQTHGQGWNQRTGAGVVDGAAATALARLYDVTAPPRRGRARRRGGGRVVVRIPRARDRTEAGHELAGRVTYALLVSRDAGRSYDLALRRRSPVRHVVRLKGSRPNALATAVCDANGNCGVRRLGRFRRR
jgi:subtilisin family serine protease